MLNPLGAVSHSLFPPLVHPRKGAGAGTHLRQNIGQQTKAPAPRARADKSKPRKASERNVASGRTHCVDAECLFAAIARHVGDDQDEPQVI